MYRIRQLTEQKTINLIALDCVAAVPSLPPEACTITSAILSLLLNNNFTSFSAALLLNILPYAASAQYHLPLRCLL